MHKNSPDVVLRAQIGFESDLTQQLIDSAKSAIYQAIAEIDFSG